MLQYHKILFPIDLSQESAKVIHHVNTIADRFHAEVHLVYVAKTSEYYREDEGNWNATRCQPGQFITQTVLDYVQKNLAVRSEPKVVVLEGAPAEVLLNYIDDSEIDLVIMASSGRSAVGKALLGSVAADIARSSPVPVVLVHPQLDKFTNPSM